MAAPKTGPTYPDVTGYLDQVANRQRRDSTRTAAAMLPEPAGERLDRQFEQSENP